MFKVNNKDSRRTPMKAKCNNNIAKATRHECYKSENRSGTNRDIINIVKIIIKVFNLTSLNKLFQIQLQECNNFKLFPQKQMKVYLASQFQFASQLRFGFDSEYQMIFPLSSASAINLADQNDNHIIPKTRISLLSKSS